MALTLSYDPQLSRVRLSCDGLSPFPVRVERSTDGVRWTTVRGGASLAPSDGVVTLDDYEFSPDVPNTYRVVGPSVYDPFNRNASASWGSTPEGKPWAVAGGTPDEFFVSNGGGRVAVSTVGSLRRTTLTSVSVGDFDIAARFQSPVAAAGTGDIITGITARLVDGGTYYYADLAWRPPNTGPGNLPYPTVEAVIVARVGAVNTIIAQARHVAPYAPDDVWWLRFKGTGSRLQASIWPASSAPPESWLLETTDTSITAPGAIGTRMSLFAGNANTTPVTLATYDYLLLSPETPVAESTITPTIGQPWLKSVARPFLNRPVKVRGISDVTRPTRTGVFEVVGRTFPVAVTDVRSSRRWTLELYAQDAQEAEDIDLMLASGDILYLQVPASGRLSVLPTAYVTVGDSRETILPTHDLKLRVFALPCTEVAAPGPDVVGATSNWQTVLNTYATWEELLADNATWADLLELVGDPTDVIVQ